MSFQAYLDNIYTKTGKTADEFKAMAAEKKLTSTGDLVSWLKSDYGLGHGHAMAIVHLIVHEAHRNATADDKVDKLFTGGKAKWRETFEKLVKKLSAFGGDVSTPAGQTYINLQRGTKKFGIVQPSSERLDIGIKIKNKAPAGRFEAAGSWNGMVTHRVRLTSPGMADQELINWLNEAYDAAG